VKYHFTEIGMVDLEAKEERTRGKFGLLIGGEREARV
jgi:hypothetical protein